MSNLVEFMGRWPQIAQDVFLAEGARLIGDVQIAEHTSIWYNCVLRGDINRVVIGHHTNIQDNSVCHVAEEHACVVGNHVTVGHGVVLHGCHVHDEVLVGMGAILMNGVDVGQQSIIGAAALLTEGLHVPPGSLVYGAPAKVISTLGEKERNQIKDWAVKYAELAGHYHRHVN